MQDEDYRLNSLSWVHHTVHFKEYTEMTQHYAALDASPRLNPAKLFLSWVRWRYSMYQI